MSNVSSLHLTRTIFYVPLSHSIVGLDVVVSFLSLNRLMKTVETKDMQTNSLAHVCIKITCDQAI